MPSGLPSISYASSIIGFLSFAFTFFTFVRVFWDTILTLWKAPKEMKLYLDNTRSELRGERAYFKTALRRSRSRSQSRVNRDNFDDLEILKLLNGTTRTLLGQFEELEEPFLLGPPKLDDKDLERSEMSMRVDYAPMTLRRRWAWMRRKDSVISIADQVTRIQTRRVAQISSSVLTRTCTAEKRLHEFDDRLWELEENVLGERLEDGNVYVRRRARR